MTKPTGGYLPTPSQLAFLFPVILRPIVEEGTDDSVIKSVPSNPLPTEDTSSPRSIKSRSAKASKIDLPSGDFDLYPPFLPYGRSPSPSSDASSSQKWALDDNENRSFMDAIYDLTSNILEPSESETAKNLRIVLSAAKKYFDGQEINDDRLATAIDEIIEKNTIQEGLSGLHLYARIAIRGSELVEMYRAPFQNAFKLEYNKNQNAGLAYNRNREEMPGERKWANFIGFRDLHTALILAGSGTVEASSWIDRSIDLYVKEQTGNGVIQSCIDAHGKDWREFLSDAFTGMTDRVLNFFPLTIEGRTLQLHNKLQVNAAQRSETGQEDGGNYELNGQLTASQRAFLALDDPSYEEKKPNQTNESEKPNQENADSPSGDEKKSPHRNSPADLTAYKMPDPTEANPITNVLGGSFSASGGSDGLKQYSAQIDVTIAGPKELPPSPILAQAKALMNPDPTNPTGGPYGNTHFLPGHNPYWKPIEKSQKAYEESYVKYKAKEKELWRAQNNLPGGVLVMTPNGPVFERVPLPYTIQMMRTPEGGLRETPDSIIARKNYEIKLAQELVELTDDVLGKAWTLFHQTGHDKVEEKKKWISAAECKKIHASIKAQLHKEFGVPHPEKGGKIHKDDLDKSSKFTTWASFITSAETDKNHAEQDKALKATYKQLNEAGRAIRELENSSGPVDPDELSGALATLKILGQQAVAQLRARGAGSPQLVEHNVKLLEDRIAAYSGRDTRYSFIESGCEKFLEQQAALLTKIQANGDEKEISEGLEKAAAQKAALVTQMADLIAQNPDNIQKNRGLMQLRNTISAEFTSVSLAKQNKAISETTQQYRETQAAILKMENSDRPVNPRLLAEALRKMNALGDLLLSQVRDKAAISPETTSDADVKNYETQIHEEIAALIRRDARYGKIVSGYLEIDELQKSILPQLIVPGNEQEVEWGMQSAAEKKATLDKQIDDLITQCPGNTDKNVELILLQRDVESKFGVLYFCRKPYAEKTAELDSIRHRIDTAASPDERSVALNDYERRASFLSLQLTACGDYKGFSKNFNDFAALLVKEEALSSESVALLDEMFKDLIPGVVNNKIDPAAHLPVLEALEKKHSATTDLKQVQLAIGSLYSMSDLSTTAAALESYKQCGKHSDNPHWLRLQVLCQMKTLHYSDAETNILNLIKRDPSNEEYRKLAANVVEDKYQNASVALEWLEMGIQKGIQMGIDRLTPKKENAISEFRQYIAALKLLKGALHVGTHPTLVMRWLPEVIGPSDDSLMTRLTDILAKDNAYAFNWFNMTSIATRAIPSAVDVVCTALPEEQYPNLHLRAKQLAGAFTVAQVPLSLYQTCASLYGLLGKYRSGELSLFSSLRGGGLGVIGALNTAAPYIQKKCYTNEEEKKKYERLHPVRNAAVNTLASEQFKQFASTTSLSTLVWNSRPLLSGLTTRMISPFMPRCDSDTVKTVFGGAMVVVLGTVLLFKAKNLYYRAKEEIMKIPPRLVLEEDPGSDSEVIVLSHGGIPSARRPSRADAQCSPCVLF